jgi:hypothetical protein
MNATVLIEATDAQAYGFITPLDLTVTLFFGRALHSPCRALSGLAVPDPECFAQRARDETDAVSGTH